VELIEAGLRAKGKRRPGGMAEFGWNKASGEGDFTDGLGRKKKSRSAGPDFIVVEAVDQEIVLLAALAGGVEALLPTHAIGRRAFDESAGLAGFKFGLAQALGQRA